MKKLWRLTQKYRPLVVGLLFLDFLSLICVSEYYQSTRPGFPQPALGRIYWPGELKGPVYLTFAESFFVNVLFFIFILGGLTLAYLVYRFEKENEDDTN